MKDNILIKHINKSIQTQFNRKIHTVNTSIYRNIITHFNKNAVYLYKESHIKFHRFLHQMIDDTNYKWDSKYIKNNLKNLDKNLEWLKSLNSLERYIVDDCGLGSLEDTKNILIKLDVFNHVDNIEEGYNKEILNNYLSNKYELLETIVPLLPNTSNEFRKKYLLTNPFIQYLYRLVSSNIENINVKLLIKYFNFLLEIGIDDFNQLLQRIYLGIYNKLEEQEEVDKEDKIDTRIKLLSRIIVKQDFNFYIVGLKNQIQEILTDCICDNKVFCKNVNEMIQILQSIYVYCVNKNGLKGNNNMEMSSRIGDEENKIGVLNKLSSIMSTEDRNNGISDRYNGIRGRYNTDIDISFITNYFEIYVDKLKDYVYMLDINTLINVLYGLYKFNYMDDKLFGKIIESVLFKFDSVSFEQMEVLLAVFSTYKYYYMLNGGDLGESLYGEGGKMLIGMMREYIENKLVNLQLSKVIDPLIALTTLSKKNQTIKPIVLKKLDSNLMDRLSVGEFSKILRLFSNLKIDKANDQVSTLIEGYVNKKLMIETNKKESYDNNRLIEGEMESILRELSRFIPKKKYNKFISNYVEKYIDEISSIMSIEDRNNDIRGREDADNDNSRIISLLRICIENKLYKCNNNEIINKLLGKIVSNMITTNNINNNKENKNKINKINNNIINKNSIINNNTINKNNNNNISKININYNSIINNMDVNDMILLLDSVDHSNLSLNNVCLVCDVVFRSIYDKFKRSERLNLRDVCGILNFFINTRIIDERLMSYLLGYVYDNYILTIPEITRNEGEYNMLDNVSYLMKKNKEIKDNDKDNNMELSSGIGDEENKIGVINKLSSIISTEDEELYKNLLRNKFKVGLYVMYLKCVKLIGIKMLDEDEEFKELLDNTYRYVISHFNYCDHEYYLTNKNGKKVVEDFKELLLFEKNNDYQYYEKLVEQMVPGVMEYLTDFSGVFKINSGKLYSRMMGKLGSEYSSYFEIEGIRYDFYSEKDKEAIHILKKEHYYVKEGNDEIHLKNKGELMKMISEKINIKLKLIPEHIIFEENDKRY